MNNPINNWRIAKQLHTKLGTRGKIIVWTRIFVAPKGYEAEVPYVVAIVEFAKGVRKTYQLVDYAEEHLKSGQKVTTVIRRIAKAEPEEIITYGIKVKPI